MTIAGVLAVRGALGFGTTSAHAQGFGGYGGAGFGYGTNGCGSTYGNVGGGLPDEHPSLPWSSARQQGWRVGQVDDQTGIASNHPLSPAEARGFLAVEWRQANTPWPIDPLNPQGWREGQVCWETGQIPNRPLSPDELQGFHAGERQAASGLRRW